MSPTFNGFFLKACISVNYLRLPSNNFHLKKKKKLNMCIQKLLLLPEVVTNSNSNSNIFLYKILNRLLQCMSKLKFKLNNQVTINVAGTKSNTGKL